MSAQLARTPRKPSAAQVLRSVTVAAGRKGVSVRLLGGEIVVTENGKRNAFPSAEKAAAYLILRGVL